jgi:cathepsin L
MQLKQALLEHGPLVVLVHMDNAFKAYKGGVFNERSQGKVNHAVVLLGWDDTKRAWLIQNSYGNKWGTKMIDEPWAIAGYMWIEWESNGIGQFAAWVDAYIDFEEVR